MPHGISLGSEVCRRQGLHGFLVEKIERKPQLFGESLARSLRILAVAEEKRGPRHTGTVLKTNQVPAQQRADGLGYLALPRIVQKLLLPQPFQEFTEGSQSGLADARFAAERAEVRIASLHERFAHPAQDARTLLVQAVKSQDSFLVIPHSLAQTDLRAAAEYAYSFCQPINRHFLVSRHHA